MGVGGRKAPDFASFEHQMGTGTRLRCTAGWLDYTKRVPFSMHGGLQYPSPAQPLLTAG